MSLVHSDDAPLVSRLFVLPVMLSLGLAANAQTAVQIPVPSGAGKLTPENPILGDEIGTTLDISGNLLVAGGSGGAWIFHNVGGMWMQQQRLVVANSSINFGCSVAIANGRVYVGDTGDDSAPITAHVFVFEHNGSSWEHVNSLPDSNGASAFDSYGSTLAVDGDTVVVGSKHVGGNIGAAFIYQHDGAQWQEEAALLAPTPRPGAVFGSAVSIFQDRVAIGAPGDPIDSVVIYGRSGSNWMPTRMFNEQDAGGVVTPNSGFGSSVALGPSTIIIGMPLNGAGGMSSGSIAIFEDMGTGFEFDENCTPTDVAPNDQFGINVALDGNRVMVGSPFDGGTGSSYLFTRSMTGLVEEAKFQPSDGQPGDRFGNSVGISGTTVAFGSPFNNEGGSWVGAVYTLTQMVSPSVIETFCNGDGGDQAGCTDCPCGNNAPQGTIGGCLNSTGTSGQLAVMGTASASNDTLRLEATRTNPMTFGLLLSGAGILPGNPANPCPPGFGIRSIWFDGLRCIGVGVRRHGVRATDSNGDIGATNAAWGLGDAPAGGLVAKGAFTIGASRYFQVNYREIGTLGCNTGLTTTNAAAAVVTP